MNVNLPSVEVTSPFWTRYRNLVKDVVLPYQWGVLNDDIVIDIPTDPAGNSFDVSKSGAIANLKIAAGLAQGSFTGFPFQDSDVYKWLEAVAYVLMYDEAPRLRSQADEVIELIAKAQMGDGYLDTYFQINGIERRFKRMEQSHELYLMGHYIEAGVAYWEATGSVLALDIARHMADCIDANFGPEEGKIAAGDGHPEIELALARLYDVTGERRYLDLAHWFIVVRGQDLDFYKRQNAADGVGADLFDTMRNLPASYLQADMPYLSQTEVNGHAVRALYLLAGAAHVARLTSDRELGKTVDRLWENVTQKRMYLTGQVGSTQVGESFTYDYDLPNDTMYGETCASVAMSFVAHRMLQARARGEYGDVLERELFNGALAGMSLDGRHFYYVNPLEADPLASARNPGKRHVLTHRAEWFGCACCPANLARLITSVDRYIYDEGNHGRTVLVNQFISSCATFSSGVVVSQEGNYPWDGTITMHVKNPLSHSTRLGIRIPGWAQGGFALTCNGKTAAMELVDSFAYVVVPAVSTLRITLDLPVAPTLVRASNRVAADAGKVAVMRGPLVYCLEEADNPGPLWNLELDTGELTSEYCPDLLGGVAVVRAPGLCEQADPEDGALYLPATTPLRTKKQQLTFVPYYAWANRENGQMSVWVRPSSSLSCA